MHVRMVCARLSGATAFRPSSLFLLLPLPLLLRLLLAPSLLPPLSANSSPFPKIAPANRIACYSSPPLDPTPRVYVFPTFRLPRHFFPFFLLPQQALADVHAFWKRLLAASVGWGRDEARPLGLVPGGTEEFGESCCSYMGQRKVCWGSASRWSDGFLLTTFGDFWRRGVPWGWIRMGVGG